MLNYKIIYSRVKKIETRDLIYNKASEKDHSAFETLNTFWLDNEIQPKSNV